MKIISFDLDGTLVTDEFTQLVWHQGIPELYAQKWGTTLEEAKAYILKEYEKVGEKALEWYDIKYWFRFFDLDAQWEQLLCTFAYLIKPYPEVLEVLSSLYGSHQLIITSNAAREFLDAEITYANLSPFFSRVFSATSDFKEVKKTASFYQKVCSLLGIDYTQLIHVGDHFEFDYLIPQQLGITSFFLDRRGTKKGNGVVSNLKEFKEKIMST